MDPVNQNARNLGMLLRGRLPNGVLDEVDDLFEHNEAKIAIENLLSNLSEYGVFVTHSEFNILMRAVELHAVDRKWCIGVHVKSE